ncbi:MAG: hypothetical protein AMK72_06465 [Planctomycetes bacterium SM23_25]|nr:MAG: hypothetical protein AMK72_06465 [Planctomycetes bacterium SM23_25]
MAEADADFDAFQPYYDVMVNWESRIGHEAPFFQRAFSSVSAKRVLDCACGTGHHVRLFARWGLEAVGSDVAASMVEQARADAREEGSPARFEVADFRNLPGRFTPAFDAVICTGNSLPLAGSADGMRQAIASMGDVLRADGLLVLHTLNFARIPQGVTVIEDPRARHVDDREILFVKIFRKTRRLCDITILVLEKQAGEWSKLETAARAWAVGHEELQAMVTQAGFDRIRFYGGYEPKPFDADTSRDLILVARKRKAAS